ncbi:MAG TPA: hypothetical protein VJ870_12910 [Amycolatopsis sp.]|nr:hypothetical protein [Amycolatopsis sp.]
MDKQPDQQKIRFALAGSLFIGGIIAAASMQDWWYFAIGLIAILLLLTSTDTHEQT